MKKMRTGKKYQIKNKNDEVLVNETFADKKSALFFAKRYLTSIPDFKIQSKNTPPLPAPPPPYVDNVICLSTFRIERKIKVLE